MLIQNDIPIMAIILEPIIAIFILVLVVMSFWKYFKRKDTSALHLSLTLLFLSLSVFSSFTGKIMDFFSPISRDILSYTDFTIVIAYCLSALSNIFLFLFIDNVFLERGYRFSSIVTLANVISIAALANYVSTDPNAYEQTFGLLVYHVIISLIICIILISISFSKSSKTSDKLPKTGFTLIGIFGIFLSLVFVFFVVDLGLGFILGGFTPFYYLGWIAGGVASIFAYLGYFMPDWFRRSLKLETGVVLDD